MRRGTFGRSFDTLEKATAAAFKLATQTGHALPIFKMKKDVCDDREAFIVMFPGRAEHIYTVSPGQDRVPPSKDDDDDADAPEPVEAR